MSPDVACYIQMVSSFLTGSNLKSCGVQISVVIQGKSLDESSKRCARIKSSTIFVKSGSRCCLLGYAGV